MAFVNKTIRDKLNPEAIEENETRLIVKKNNIYYENIETTTQDNCLHFVLTSD